MIIFTKLARIFKGKTMGDAMAGARKARVLAASILSIVLVSCSGEPNPIPVDTDTTYFGKIVHGEKFGVVIGQSEAEARRALSNERNHFTGKFDCNEGDVTIAFLECKSGERFLKFYHKQFGKTGLIFLRTTNNQISEIAWSFQFLVFDT